MKKNIMITMLCLCVLLSVQGCGSDEEIVVSDSAEEGSSDYGALPSGDEADEEAPAGETAEASAVFVYIIGAVKSPGVYEVPTDTRLFKVIEAAGGFAEDAAMESLNLAETVQDGSVYRVLNRQEYEGLSKGQAETNDSGVIPGTAHAENDGRVNINTASVSELTSINGIGESRAQAIISYREENGAFKSIEDIKNVTGIKDGIFNKIKDSIKV